MRSVCHPRLVVVVPVCGLGRRAVGAATRVDGRFESDAARGDSVRRSTESRLVTPVPQLGLQSAVANVRTVDTTNEPQAGEATHEHGPAS